MTQTRRSILPAQRHVLRLASAAASAALAFAAASSASAGGDQAIRITADIPVAGFVHVFYPNSVPSQTVGLIGLPAGTYYSGFGANGASVALGAGYLFRKNIYVGGRFNFQTFFPDNSDAIFQGRLSGRFEYVFGGGGDKVRPFVGGDLGFYAIAFPTGAGGTSSYGGFIGSGSGGVHLFLADSFTLSPYGELAFQRLFDFDQNAVSLIFGVTLAGWIWR
jgi:hypothetical protein